MNGFSRSITSPGSLAFCSSVSRSPSFAPQFAKAYRVASAMTRAFSLSNCRSRAEGTTSEKARATAPSGIFYSRKSPEYHREKTGASRSLEPFVQSADSAHMNRPRWIRCKSARGRRRPDARQNIRDSRAGDRFLGFLSLTLANSEQAHRPRGMRNIRSLSTIS
jgi:hypothetical protein